MDNITVLAPTNNALDEYEKERGANKEQKELEILSGESEERERLDTLERTYQGMTRERVLLHVIRDGRFGIDSWIDGMVWESYSGWRKTNNHTEREGVMLKSRVSRGGKVLVGGIEIEDGELHCSAGVVQTLGGVLNFPPTLEELVLQNYHLGINRKAYKHKVVEQKKNNYNSYLDLIKATGWYEEIIGSKDLNFNNIQEGREKGRRYTLWLPHEADLVEQFSRAQWNYLVGAGKAAISEKKKVIARRDARRIARWTVTSGSISLARLGQGVHRVNILGIDKPVSDDYLEVNVTSSYTEQNEGRGNQVQGVPVEREDLVAVDGIAHFLGKAKETDKYKKEILTGGIEWTPEKGLIGLNATKFIEMVESVGLAKYINGEMKNEKMTILVPTNEAIDEWYNNNEINKANMMGNNATESVREFVLYHMIHGSQYTKETLSDGQLLQTELETAKLKQQKQVIKVGKSTDDKVKGLSLHQQRSLPQKSWITFNGVAPEFNGLGLDVTPNCTVYLLKAALTPPGPMILSMVRSLSHSLFAAVVGASGTYDEILYKGTNQTAIIPSNDAFFQLGLAYSYLSLENDKEAMSDLARLVRGHVINRVVYSDEFDITGQNCASKDKNSTIIQVQTLNGTPLWLTRDSDCAIYLSVINPFLPNNNIKDIFTYKISTKDVLFDGGCLHLLESASSHPSSVSCTFDFNSSSDSDVSGLLIPPNLVISPKKLLRGMPNSSLAFRSLLSHLNLTFVLEDNQDVSEQQHYSLLVPNDRAWSTLPAYREFQRRYSSPNSHASGSGDNEIDNPWRNKTNSQLDSYLLRMVKYHILLSSKNADKNQNSHDKPSSFATTNIPTLLDGTFVKQIIYPNNRLAFQPIDEDISGGGSGGRGGKNGDINNPYLPPYLPSHSFVLNAGKIINFYHHQQDNSSDFGNINGNSQPSESFVFELDSFLVPPLYDSNNRPPQSGFLYYASTVLVVFFILGLSGGMFGLIVLWVHAIRTTYAGTEHTYHQIEQ
ncbi:hypothetical protein AX774_g2695 [Zancudomyces culisetae]|uniref:FAS1 domain-containing protein n=1 Tax=Zancudomyces culisetae TaxID=1213189 RepID=A0A1R1PS30_ZANCU|nr:hypothetical protein AX774_g2695 [Zancudomyces culisetae]|eukprot:OMH83790.1 hypothetical protein AX774_g2695 [Zancudomyces culisetae]